MEAGVISKEVGEKNMIFLKEKKKFSTTRMIATGFLVAIVLGTILLSLPIATKDRSVTPLPDTLFTATTSICVTGLTTVSTLDHWSVFGKIVILALIQFGGLGVITFSTIILLLLGRRITLNERLLIQDAYNLDTLKGMVKLTKTIVRGTFLIEGIGAVLYSIQFIQDYGFFSGIARAIFNSWRTFPYNKQSNWYYNSTENYISSDINEAYETGFIGDWWYWISCMVELTRNHESNLKERN